MRVKSGDYFGIDGYLLPMLSPLGDVTACTRNEARANGGDGRLVEFTYLEIYPRGKTAPSPCLVPRLSSRQQTDFISTLSLVVDSRIVVSLSYFFTSDAPGLLD